MRVIGGSARGRPLQAPAGQATRPTGDRVRQAIFNALGSQIDLDGARVADLFAGSGALGIEALSRGAAHVTFVEQDPSVRRVIAHNLHTCGFEARARVLGGDANDVVSTLGPLDLALCDPPYRFEGWELLLGRLDAQWVVIESDREIDAPAGWELARTKRYGSTVVRFLQRAANGSEGGSERG
ncbi:MAG: 16S rRNA (guanine(966)-N(2))-methyltransferase RsmD [Acidimicrobiales bacterium]